MLHTNPSHLYHLPIYKKALEILFLSRRISKVLRYDLSKLKQDGSEDQDIYVTGDIVQQSESLAPEILKAELSETEKERHVETLDWLSRRLYKSCMKLELSNSHGRDYVPILRKELKNFRKLQRSWMLTL